MDIQELLKLYASHSGVSALDSLIREGKDQNIALRGVNGSASAMLIASLFVRQSGNFICLLNDLEEAGYFYNDLKQLTGSESVYFFPSAYRRDIKYGHTDPANEILRTETLSVLNNKHPRFIIVSYPEALAEKVVTQDLLRKNTLQIHVGEKLGNAFIMETLESYGFERVDYVYEPGQYAIRGSIVDVFSYSFEYPYRIDFFGDEVETIRAFDVETQLSKEKLDNIYIVSEVNKKSADSGGCLLGSLPNDTILASHDLAWCRERIGALWNEEPVIADEESFSGIEAMQAKLVRWDDFMHDALRLRQIQFGNHPVGDVDATLSFQTQAQPIFHKNFDMVSESFRKYLDEGYSLYILSDVEKQAARIRSIFEDRGENIPFTAVNKTIHAGFADQQLKVCFFTDHQLFDRFHKYNLKSDKARSGKITLSLKELNQFTPGDYIVHIDHGIGQFGGLVRMEVNGKMQEVIKLIYQNNDAIFVSIHSLHKLSKYKGKDNGEPPKLNKLGTGAWEKMKERTKKKVKDIARDLIILYAKRKREQGFAFSPDSFMQQELEASFIYEDTPDQVRATAEVKADMESPRPMDRLICGDVGFGKTEVAIRAAFKAVADNKQVAVLVPTTVLAFQHYQTFSERLKDFPCKIDYVSRAKTTAQIKRTLEAVKKGDVDILIGTHRIVSKDVSFKDLGLLIIDEEQKFGVSVKEKLRQLKTNVDTLTMTALALLIAVPFGVFSAIYLVEYAGRGNKIVGVVRITTETLSGIPSIVYGLFGYLMFVTAFKSYNIMAGILTLAIMILPLIMRTTEEALKGVPDSYREGSLGLGAGKLRTVFRVVLPSAIPGILAGVILGIGRIVGETAALLYTAGTVTGVATSLFSSGRTLSVHMYALLSEGLYTDQAYATAVVLLVMVIIINALSGLVARAVGRNKE